MSHYGLGVHGSNIEVYDVRGVPSWGPSSIWGGGGGGGGGGLYLGSRIFRKPPYDSRGLIRMLWVSLLQGVDSGVHKSDTVGLGASPRMLAVHKRD